MASRRVRSLPRSSRAVRRIFFSNSSSFDPSIRTGHWKGTRLHLLALTSGVTRRVRELLPPQNRVLNSSLTGPSGKFQGFVYARPVRGTGVQEKLSEEERTLRNLEPLEVCSKSIWCFVAQEEVSRAEDRGVQHRYSDDRLFEWRLIPHTLKPFKQICLMP